MEIRDSWVDPGKRVDGRGRTIEDKHHGHDTSCYERKKTKQISALNIISYTTDEHIITCHVVGSSTRRSFNIVPCIAYSRK